MYHESTYSHSSVGLLGFGCANGSFPFTGTCGWCLRYIQSTEIVLSMDGQRISVRPRVVVRKSRGSVFAGTWYVLAFGKCTRYRTWDAAIRMAVFMSPRHIKWANKINNATQVQAQTALSDKHRCRNSTDPNLIFYGSIILLTTCFLSITLAE